MEHDIVYYHRQLQSYIHKVEQDETDKEALQAVKDAFLIVFDMIKLIMISKQERYYGLFLMNFELRVDFSAYHDAGVSIDSFPYDGQSAADRSKVATGNDIHILP